MNKTTLLSLIFIFIMTCARAETETLKLKIEKEVFNEAFNGSPELWNEMKRFLASQVEDEKKSKERSSRCKNNEEIYQKIRSNTVALSKELNSILSKIKSLSEKQSSEILLVPDNIQKLQSKIIKESIESAISKEQLQVELKKILPEKKKKIQYIFKMTSAQNFIKFIEFQKVNLQGYTTLYKEILPVHVSLQDKEELIRDKEKKIRLELYPRLVGSIANLKDNEIEALYMFYQAKKNKILYEENRLISQDIFLNSTNLMNTKILKFEKGQNDLCQLSLTTKYEIELGNRVTTALDIRDKIKEGNHPYCFEHKLLDKSECLLSIVDEKAKKGLEVGEYVMFFTSYMELLFQEFSQSPKSKESNLLFHKRLQSAEEKFMVMDTKIENIIPPSEVKDSTDKKIYDLLSKQMSEIRLKANKNSEEKLSEVKKKILQEEK